MRALLLAPFALAPSMAFAQIIPVQLPPLAPGLAATTRLNFASGNEYYALIGNTTVNMTANSGHGMIIDTVGSTLDTELAVYGNNGAQLVAFNDDGGTPPGGASSVGLTSVMTFGDEPAYTGAYDGNTTGACTSTHNLPAGSYIFVVSLYSTVWGCPGATATTKSSSQSGPVTVHGAIF